MLRSVSLVSPAEQNGEKRRGGGQKATGRSKNPESCRRETSDRHIRSAKAPDEGGENSAALKTAGAGKKGNAVMKQKRTHIRQARTLFRHQ